MSFSVKQDGYLTRGSSISALGINVSSGRLAFGVSPSSGVGADQPLLIMIENGVPVFNPGFYGLGVSNGMLTGNVVSTGYGGAWRLYEY